MNKYNLSQYQLDCIRFYMGDPLIVEQGSFIGGPKAYNTINALLHDGIVNELDKIKEGKPIEINNGQHLEQTVLLIKAIDEAMNEVMKHKNTDSPLITYRIDRLSEIKSMMEKGRIEGFYSTCKRGFLTEYANTKKNIVLMEIEREADVPFLDFELLFENLYAKPQEAEILLPFDSKVKSVTPIELTELDKQLYKDMEGNPPCGKYRIVLSSRDNIIGKAKLDDLVSLEIAERISYCMKQLTMHAILDEDDLQFYLKWKKSLRKYLLGRI